MPIAPAFSSGADIIVAVNLGGKPDPNVSVRVKEVPPPKNDLVRKVHEFVDSLDIPGQIKRAQEGGMFEIAMGTFDTMQSAIARQQLAAYPPDYVITIPRNLAGTLEFNRAAELIELGYELAEKKLSGI